MRKKKRRVFSLERISVIWQNEEFNHFLGDEFDNGDVNVDFEFPEWHLFNSTRGFIYARTNWSRQSKHGTTEKFSREGDHGSGIHPGSSGHKRTFRRNRLLYWRIRKQAHGIVEEQTTFGCCRTR